MQRSRFRRECGSRIGSLRISGSTAGAIVSPTSVAHHASGRPALEHLRMSLSTNLSPDKQRDMLRQMLTIRRFEERASADYLAGKIHGVVHCYIGEEAVAVGVCSALGQIDRIISTHRGHGHCIANGADLNRMMAELYGRQTGYCKGKGGSMQIADFGIGMLGAT